MRALLVVLAWLSGVQALPAQSVLGTSPNLRSGWTLAPGHPGFAFTHRFEFLSGGDELINFPTLSLGIGLPAGVVAGLDYTSNSEIVRERLGGNETQFWLQRDLVFGELTRLGATAAYNTAARSLDGALTARQRVGPVTVLGELRGFSDLFGTEEAGVAAAGGGVLHLTRYLQIAGDVGRVLEPDTFDSVWSAGLGIAIPGTPHTLSLHAANTGAITLQSASRRKVLGPESTRYGFVFTLPLGTRSQWVRVFRGDPPGDRADAGPRPGVAARVEMRQIAFTPREIRIRAGETVEWINRDPVGHTVTADDGSWGSELLAEGERYVRRFDRPGRYSYHCIPHPMMTAVVIVESAKTTLSETSSVSVRGEPRAAVKDWDERADSAARLRMTATPDSSDRRTP